MRSNRGKGVSDVIIIGGTFLVLFFIFRTRYGTPDASAGERNSAERLGSLCRIRLPAESDANHISGGKRNGRDNKSACNRGDVRARYSLFGS